MSELLLSVDAFTIPTTVGRPLVFDMRRIHKAESRIHELATVTKDKAGELLAVFIESASEAKTYLGQLKAELGRAKQRIRTVSGRITLDEAPDLLKTKGLASTRSPAGSADLRDAVVNTSPAYLDAVEHQMQLEAAVDLMDSKYEKLKMSYYSIDGLITGTPGKRSISGGVGDSDEPGVLTPTERLANFTNDHAVVNPNDYTGGFGAPKI